VIYFAAHISTGNRVFAESKILWRELYPWALGEELFAESQKKISAKTITLGEEILRRE
jgi:hypothetical protein